MRGGATCHPPIAGSFPCSRGRCSSATGTRENAGAPPGSASGVTRSLLWRRQSRAHQVDEVVAVEPLLRALVETRHALLEAADRVPPAFDVWVVGGEETDLFARLLDDPADGLRRVRRRTDLAPHVLARPERELPEPLLALAEGLVRRVELAHPARQPDRTLFDHAEAEPREAVEDAVDDQRREG